MDGVNSGTHIKLFLKPDNKPNLRYSRYVVGIKIEILDAMKVLTNCFSLTWRRGKEGW